ncbi:hypothetical protein CEXT_642591 [Caerostris extrusa]|uniref:Uncharacterized protein n=1 Tax=Caerostris extrusa TaxID=172846 RepID=A0AAV4S3Q8_CAEEX|nr:hypothetical protein CEXT_642591 [Caerostris extrusa]
MVQQCLRPLSDSGAYLHPEYILILPSFLPFSTLITNKASSEEFQLPHSQYRLLITGTPLHLSGIQSRILHSHLLEFKFSFIPLSLFPFNTFSANPPPVIPY